MFRVSYSMKFYLDSSLKIYMSVKHQSFSMKFFLKFFNHEKLLKKNFGETIVQVSIYYFTSLFKKAIFIRTNFQVSHGEL